MRPIYVAESPDAHGRSGYDALVGRKLLEVCDFKFRWHDIHGAKPPRWSKRVAQARAADWISQNHLDVDSPLILLGVRVWDAFGCPPDARAFEWFRSPTHGHPLICLPHPLRRDPPFPADKASQLLTKLGLEQLPSFERTVDVGGKK